MAKTVDMPANKKAPKWRVRHRNRCHQCGRARGFLRKFDLCRVCFRLFCAARRHPRRHQIELVDRCMHVND